MDVLADLQQIGFSENEAKVYLALLGRAEASGYEAARLAGVPRAKVYEILDSMVSKGTALAMDLDGKRLFRAVPYEELLSRKRNETETTLARLAESLAAAALPAEAEQPLFTLSGHEAILARCQTQLAAAQHSAFVSIWPGEMEVLAQAISDAKERGVPCYVVLYDGGEPGFDDQGICHHGLTIIEAQRKEDYGHWLLVATDTHEVTLASLAPDQQTALCAQNRLLGSLITGWVAHDAYLSEASRHLGPDAEKVFPSETNQHLRRMWQVASAPWLEPGYK